MPLPKESLLLQILQVTFNIPKYGYGASTANLAIILVDARNGIVEQTKRHSFIASLLGIPHIIYCINKMDLVDHDCKAFSKIKDELTGFSSKLNTKDIRFIPISALNGDNIVNRSNKMNGMKEVRYYIL